MGIDQIKQPSPWRKRAWTSTTPTNIHSTRVTDAILRVNAPSPQTPANVLLFHALSQIPWGLRLLLYICSLNFLFLVFGTNHHFDFRHDMHRELWDGSDDNQHVQIVIVSNRLKGILPTVSSILTHTHSKPVDLVLIGDHVINERVRQQFAKPSGNRTNTLHQFTSLTVQDVQDDLIRQGHQPIWTWEEWGSSRQPNWANENTIHRASWDELETHAHELNHLRFYLPYLSIFRRSKYLYFLDDDVLVQKDLGHVADSTMENWDPTKAIMTPCNIWMWSDKCHIFDFQDEESIDSILNMPSLYGDRTVCTTDSEPHCVPKSYQAFLQAMLPRSPSNPHPEQQKAWNFGFSLFALEHWRKLRLTRKYEAVMKESYRRHVFPETSLAFGLGVSYIAFAGAVACWKDENMRIRDGFGFIEYGRYQRSLGMDFMSSMDVIHYTGPQKPWAANTTIDPRSLQPWIDMMTQEAMNVPVQLGTETTKDLFVLLASARTGSNWIMTTLDSHPEICASGEDGKPESGFPTDAMFPGGLPWFPTCSIKRSCTYAYIRDAILDLHKTMDKRGRTALTPLRCQTRHRKSSDPLGEHLSQVCNFVQELNGNFTESNIARVWVDAFQREDKDFLSCSCQRGSKIKGLKVLTEWITYENFPNEKTGPPAIEIDDTALSGSKVIRLKRRNLWARYKSEILAQKANMFHVTTLPEKQTQLRLAGSITISVDDMLSKISLMQAEDLEGDRWASLHGSDVLWLEYEQCCDNTEECFRRIFDFLGVDQSYVDSEKKRFQSIFASFDLDSSLDKVKNKGAVEEALQINGFGNFINESEYAAIQFLRHDPSEIVPKSHPFHRVHGITTTTFGANETNHGQSEALKFAGAIPILQSMKPDALVVLTSTNASTEISFPPGGDFKRYSAINQFREIFNGIVKTYPGAVVASAGEYCCAGALTRSSPGDYFDKNGQRTAYSCFSGDKGCTWNGETKALPWQRSMKELAEDRSSEQSRNIYLDASIVAGKAVDMLRFIESTRVGVHEDERAIWTDYMLTFPDRIVLDYHQELFVRRREDPKEILNQGCPFVSGFNETLKDSRALSAVGNKRDSAIFRYQATGISCSNSKSSSEKRSIFPDWSPAGIEVTPILDHFDRVVNKEISVVLPMEYGLKPDYRQGPEIPYIIDENAILTSEVIRARTDEATLKWRVERTEAFFLAAHRILLSESENNKSRWSTLKHALSNGGVPFWAWFGDYKSCAFQNFNTSSIPVLTPSARLDCDHAFPIPNYMNIIDAQLSSDNWRGIFRETGSKYPWNNKTRKVVWRGALSEAEWRDTLQSARWRANKLIHALKSNLYDVGITAVPPWVSDKINVDISEVGGLAQQIHPMAEFQKYLAILDMDGNSWSSRFASLMCYNSVVLKLQPKYVEYFWHDLKPWTHYIPVSDDLSDLQRNVEWALDPSNDKAVRDIVMNANEWCSQRLVIDQLAYDLLDIWESYTRFLDAADPGWQTAWSQKKEQMLTNSNASFGFVTL